MQNSKMNADGFRSMFLAYLRGPLGFVFFVAWIYCAYYSDILLGSAASRYSTETYWAVSMLTMFVAAVVFLALSAKGVRLASHSWAPWISALFCAAGCTCIRAASILADMQAASILLPLGGIVMGIGFAAMVIVWGSFIVQRDTAMIEFIIPLSFPLGIILRFALSVVPNAISWALVAALPLLSLVILRVFRQTITERPQEACTPGPAPKRPLLPKGLIATCVLLSLFWVFYSFFRVFAANVAPQSAPPAALTYLVDIVVYSAFILFALRTARAINFMLVFKWVLPFVVLTLSLLMLGNERLLPLAWITNAIVSISLHAFFWIALSKVVHRQQGDAQVYFSYYLMALSSGIVIGTLCGHAAVANLDGQTTLALLPFALFFLVCVTMVLGGSTERLFEKNTADTEAEDVSSGDLLADAWKQQSRRMATAYKLSPREEEIVSYLLAGRNRPYIRDELYISLNTVNTHIRNIFSKVDAHSQQELLDIAREEFPVSSIDDAALSVPNGRTL